MHTRLTQWMQQHTTESKEKWKELKHRKFLVAVVISLSILLLAVFVYLVLVPVISEIVITKLLELRNGSNILTLWQHQPLPLITKVYLWNLTNAADVAIGLSSPVFQQVGPYIYEQFKEKIPVEFKKDSIVYYARTKFQFRDDLTAPASLDDFVITLNAGLYGAAKYVEGIAPSMVYLINEAQQYLFPGIESVFVSVRVGDYLFDGIVLNCSNVEGTTAAMICNALPSYAPPTIRKKENSSDFVYSFLAHKNYTLDGPYEEDRGLTDIRRLGRILSFNSQTQLETWQKDSQCNQLHGTDSLIFAPFIRKSDRLEIYISDICQVVPLYFESEDVLQDLYVYKFTIPDIWLESDLSYPENSCYCEEGKEFCHRRGLRDISECMKAPVVMSLPHFFQADDEFHSYAQGMKPDPDLHTSVLYIEPQTGSPVKAAKRVQFNMYLKRIEGFNLVQNVSEGLFPLMWIEESILVSKDVLAAAKQPLTIQWVVNTACLCMMVLALSTACCALLAFLYLRRAACFHNLTTNQVTVLSYRPSQNSQVKP